MKLNINTNFQSLLWPLTTEEKNQLTENIIKEGCRDSIIVWNGTIVDGHNRYEICQENNITFTTSSMSFDNESQVIEWIDKNQVGRRNITADQLRIIRGRTYNRLKKVVGKPTGTILGQIDPITTANKLAKEYGVSERTIKRDSQFATKVEKDVTLRKAIADKIPIKQITKELKAEKRNNDVQNIRKKIETENINITDKFDVIVIDPPWNYSEHGGSDVDNHDSDGNRGVVPYPTMTIKQIKDIQLPLKDNAVVFLWTTHAFLSDAFELLKHWGLDYKATIVWDKEKMGIGRIIRLQCEFCLLATKGKPTITGSSTRDIIRESRREHSRKPEAFYKLVEMITIGSKLDYFAREQRKGWKVYGIESDKF